MTTAAARGSDRAKRQAILTSFDCYGEAPEIDDAEPHRGHAFHGAGNPIAGGVGAAEARARVPVFDVERQPVAQVVERRQFETGAPARPAGLRRPRVPYEDDSARGCGATPQEDMPDESPATRMDPRGERVDRFLLVTPVAGHDEHHVLTREIGLRHIPHSRGALKGEEGQRPFWVQSSRRRRSRPQLYL